MMRKNARLIIPGGAFLATLAAGAGVALAQHADNGISMLEAKSGLAQEVHNFHNYVLMPIMTGISVLVLALLIWVVLRFNHKANPVAQRFSHNTLIEIIWTGVPILILLFIALFSFDLLYKEDVVPDGKAATYAATGATKYAFANDFNEGRKITRPDHVEVLLNNADGSQTLLTRGADYRVSGLGEDEIIVTLNESPGVERAVEIRGGRSRVGPTKVFGLFGEDESRIILKESMTIKVTGFQWGWRYAYPEFGDPEIGDIELTSLMEAEENTTPELYRLKTDNPIYVPVGETIRLVLTATDVIHAFALPNFAIKIDAVPGRVNQAWFNAPEEGVYYGQCSEICGVKHAYMPIEVHVVSKEKFIAWINEQRELNGMEPLVPAQAFAAPRDERQAALQTTAAGGQ